MPPCADAPLPESERGADALKPVKMQITLSPLFAERLTVLCAEMDLKRSDVVRELLRHTTPPPAWLTEYIAQVQATRADNQSRGEPKDTDHG